MDNWSIHSILINKRIPFEEAEKKALSITNKKKIKSRQVAASSGAALVPRRGTQTKNFYRFRAVPKTHFSEFRSKKINKDIRIVFGKLKPEYQKLEGSGILDDLVKSSKKLAKQVIETGKSAVAKVSEIVGPSSKYNNISTKTLNTYGDKIIKSMKVVRTPINSLISSALNLLTFGKMEELKKKYHYDKLFHLSILCEIDDKLIFVEKNEVVNISPNFKITDQSQSLDVPLNKSISLFQLVENTKTKMGDNFFIYDAFKNNCQDFIINVLDANGLLNENLREFIKQPMEDLVKELPSNLPKVARAITNVGAILSRLRGDGGQSPPSKRGFASRDGGPNEGGSRASGFMARLAASNAEGRKGKDFTTEQGEVKEYIPMEARKLNKVSKNILKKRVKQLAPAFYKYIKEQIKDGKLVYKKEFKYYELNEITRLFREFVKKTFKEGAERTKLLDELETEGLVGLRDIFKEPEELEGLKIQPKPPKKKINKSYSKPKKSFEFYKNYLENNMVPSAKMLMPQIQKYNPMDVALVESTLNREFGGIDKNIYKVGNNSIRGARSPLVKANGEWTTSVANQNGKSLFIILNELKELRGAK
jgi:hypothetical protein